MATYFVFIVENGKLSETGVPLLLNQIKMLKKARKERGSIGSELTPFKHKNKSFQFRCIGAAILQFPLKTDDQGRYIHNVFADCSCVLAPCYSVALEAVNTQHGQPSCYEIFGKINYYGDDDDELSLGGCSVKKFTTHLFGNATNRTQTLTFEGESYKCVRYDDAVLIWTKMPVTDEFDLAATYVVAHTRQCAEHSIALHSRSLISQAGHMFS